jgi:RNA polymerase sigma factor (sigma-70 family)
MATRAANRLIRSVRALASGPVPGESDQELLDRFVHQHDEAAFVALLERHGPMVLGVCRRALQDEHLAEDVFQATFLVLARSAGSIRQRRSLSSWLHGVALRLSRKASAAATRATRDADRLAPEPPPGPAAEASWREVRQILDDELGRLPERYRLPLVLCHLEGRTREETAAELGCTLGRLKGLLERGRERLRARLIRRGLAPASVGALLLTETALAVPVPPLLTVTTLRIALSSGAKGLASCGASAPVRSLVEGGLPMAGAKNLLLVLVFALVSGAVGLGMFGEPDRDPAPRLRAGDDPPRKEPPRAEKPKVDKPDDDGAVKAHLKALHDGDSAVRAAAAEALRRIVAKYLSDTIYLRSKDGGEAAWQEKVNQVKPGMTKAEVLKMLPAFAEAPEKMEIADGDSHIVSYRLDYHWVVTIYYRNPDKVIERPTLNKRALRVHVEPPRNFTGTWITWHVNGQKGYEIQYANGQYDGVFTSFHDNGKKSYEQHYVNHTAHGADTGWLPDGKLSYTAQYRNGQQDGTWTHWYANGNKQSETNYANGKYNGRVTNWHENGQIGSINDYKDGVKHGLEASWDEKGVPHYERVFENGQIVERPIRPE